MKTYLKIENDEEIDVKALTLLGASTKREDTSKIGFFGSGLKYAIAVLLRNEIEVKIFSGETEIKITTKKQTFRGMEFNNIYVNGKPTSLTIEMGIDWKPWFAIREIYCNALDEEGLKKDVVSEFSPEAGKTQFYIELNDKLEELTADWKRYFSSNREDIIESGGGLTLYEKHLPEKILVYRRGVQCYDRNLTSLFDYDSSKVEINESRVIKYEWEFREELAEFFQETASSSVIDRLLEAFHSCSTSTSWETLYELGIDWSRSYLFSDNWLTAINDRYLVPQEFAGRLEPGLNDLILPNDLIQSLSKKFGKQIKVKGRTISDKLIVEMDDKQKEIFNKAVEIINQGIGKFENEVIVCQFDNEDLLGTVEGKKILISDKVFGMGLKQTIATIIEELFHIKSDADDFTRTFQNYLIEIIVNYAADKAGTII